MKKEKKSVLIALKIFKQRTVFAYEPAWIIIIGTFAHPGEPRNA